MSDIELTQEEKIEKANQAFKEFADSFGPNDIYKEALLDVLLEIIYEEPNGDDLCVSGETGQTNDPVVNNDRSGEMPTYEIE